MTHLVLPWATPGKVEFLLDREIGAGIRLDWLIFWISLILIDAIREIWLQFCFLFPYKL